MRGLWGAAGVAALLVAASPPALAQADPELPPAGFGTLNQDELALTLRTDELEIRIVPLDERVTRLLAPDAYASLSGLVHARRAQVEDIATRAGAADPGLLLVSFFARSREARFDAQDVTLTIRNRLLRPLGIVALSPAFGSQQLGLRQRASAIYVFEQELPIYESFTLAYGAVATDDWAGKINLIERERGRVAGRARRAVAVDTATGAEP